MKYIGSKAKISKYIAPILQDCIDSKGVERYYEPFLGGANMMDKISAPKRIGNDIHFELIEMWKYLLTGGAVPDHISEDEYHRVREHKERYAAWYVGFVGFHATFGAKYFGGYARGFKDDGVTPRDHSNEAVRNTLAQISQLQNVMLFNKDYQETKKIKGYVIYADPPYSNSTEYKHGKFDHNYFWNWCRTMSKKNFVFISEYSAPGDFKCIWQKEVATTLKVETHESRIEKLFVYEKKL